MCGVVCEKNERTIVLCGEDRVKEERECGVKQNEEGEHVFKKGEDKGFGSERGRRERRDKFQKKKNGNNEKSENEGQFNLYSGLFGKNNQLTNFG